MNFISLISAIAFKCLFDESFLDCVLRIGAKVSEWPESAARSLMSALLVDREKSNFQFAQWNSYKSLERDKCAELATGVNLPHDEMAFKTLYDESFGIFRALDLVSKISRQPERAAEFVRVFEAHGANVAITQDMADGLEAAAREIDVRARSKQARLAIPGWYHLSDLIGGFNPSRLAICMADSGFGKTNLALNLAYRAQEIMDVLYINMEMDLLDIYTRFIAMYESRDIKDIESHGVGDITSLQARLSRETRLEMSDGKDLPLSQIKDTARSFQKRKPKLGLLVVDYDQKLMLEVSKNQPEWMAIQRAIVDLESLAKELKIFVLVLAQTNQDGEISGSHRMRFPAWSVWRFHSDEKCGPVISFKKNRGGPKNQAISCRYDAPKCQVSESGYVYLEPKQTARRL